MKPSPLLLRLLCAWSARHSRHSMRLCALAARKAADLRSERALLFYAKTLRDLTFAFECLAAGGPSTNLGRIKLPPAIFKL